MKYLKGFFFSLLIALLFLTGCAVNDVDSDFPEARDDREYYPLMHFNHMTDFRHLQTEWPLLLTEEMTQC